MSNRIDFDIATGKASDNTNFDHSFFSRALGNAGYPEKDIKKYLSWFSIFTREEVLFCLAAAPSSEWHYSGPMLTAKDFFTIFEFFEGIKNFISHRLFPGFYRIKTQEQWADFLQTLNELQKKGRGIETKDFFAEHTLKKRKTKTIQIFTKSASYDDFLKFLYFSVQFSGKNEGYIKSLKYKFSNLRKIYVESYPFSSKFFLKRGIDDIFFVDDFFPAIPIQEKKREIKIKKAFDWIPLLEAFTVNDGKIIEKVMPFFHQKDREMLKKVTVKDCKEFLKSKREKKNV